MKTRQARTTVFHGKEVPLKEVASELGISYQIVWRRVTAFNETGDDIENGTRRGSRKAKLHEHGGEALTVAEWSNKLGVSEICIRMRLRRYGTPFVTGKMGGKPQLFNGKTIDELAEEHGIRPDTLRERLRKREPIETALGHYRPNLHKLLNGVLMSETMKLHGVSRQLANYRIKHGWSVEDAISTPPRRWIRKD